MFLGPIATASTYMSGPTWDDRSDPPLDGLLSIRILPPRLPPVIRQLPEWHLARGPNLKTADLNLTKKFPITESVEPGFEAQFINLTNTPIFSLPAAWPGPFSDCDSCNGIRTSGPSGGGDGTVGTFGMEDGSNPWPRN